ncbi:MAG: SidA/IucD/PvdA family monooxygenase [Sphingomonadales bacterium]|nr:SidA/IucD/PvdA family monooxygenase [Sphingomonadales bacterium]
MAESRSFIAGIGFGPSNIALAVAMRDLGFDQSARFFEKAPSEQWQHHMLLSGSDIQHNPLRDFSTPVNPMGFFTFANYLKEKNKFFEYLNLGLTYAYRLEFADYVTWVRSHFEEWIEPSCVERLERTTGSSPEWKITLATGDCHFAKVAIVGTGRARRIPKVPGVEGNRAVIHLSDYLAHVSDRQRTDPIIIVGASQSAAEIAIDLLRRGFSNLYLVHRSFSLQLKDTSPFSDHVYFPEFTDYYYSLPPAARAEIGRELRRTNYSSVDKDVLDDLYRLRYQAGLAGEQPLRILNNHELVEFTSTGAGHALRIRERYLGTEQTIPFALTVFATGFLDMGADGPDAIPAPLRDLTADLITDAGGIDVSRNYRVNFARGGSYPPLFLNGLCENSHGLGDAGSFSLVSIRARDILSAIQDLA